MDVVNSDSDEMLEIGKNSNIFDPKKKPYFANIKAGNSNFMVVKKLN